MTERTTMSVDGGAPRTTPGGLEAQESSVDVLSDQLLKQAMQPFESLTETLKRPAWTATFAHHLIEMGDGLDLFYFLTLEQFDAHPTEERARRLYDFFFANHGATISLEVDEHVVLSIERQLNQPPVNLAVLQKLCEQPREDAAKVVEAHLADFAAFVSVPAQCAATGANKLISLLDDDESGVMVTEKGVIKAMLLEHLEELRDSTDQDPERQRQSQQLYTSLSEFLEEYGISVGVVPGGSLKQKSYKMKQVKTSQSGAARYKGRKVHTHKGHHFVVTTYTHPTWCDHCGNLLWGLMKQGWRCVDCGFDVHKAKDRTGYTQCHREIANQCPGFRKKDSSLIVRRSGSQKRGDMSRRKSPAPLRRGVSVDTVYKRQQHLYSTAPTDSGDSDGGGFSSPATPATPATPQPGAPTPPNGTPSGTPPPRRSPRSPRKDYGGGAGGGYSAVGGGGTDGPVVGDPDEDDEDEDDDGMVFGVHAVPDAELMDPRQTTPKTFKEWCNPTKYKQLDKKERSRQEALYELIRTEAEYTWYLLIIEQVFKRRVSESGIVAPRVALQLFGNISALVTMHRQFRTALEQLQHDCDRGALVSPGRVLRDCLAVLEKTEYAQFVSNQDMARVAYNELDEDGAKLVAECEQWEPIAKNRWKLTDFICQPFQRVVRYPLLLRAVLKYTPPSATEEREAIESAITGSEDLLDFLNQVKAEVEVRRRLQKMAASTTYSADITGPETDWLLKMYQHQTEILHEGRLELRNRDGKKERDLEGFLFKNALLLLRRQNKTQGTGWEMERYTGSKGGILLPIILLGGVHCTSNGEERSGTSFYVIRSEPTSFVYLGLPQMYELTAPKSSEAKKWISVIKKANHKFEAEHPDWKEVLVERYGVERPPSSTSPPILLGDDIARAGSGATRSTLRRSASDKGKRRTATESGLVALHETPRSSSVREGDEHPSPLLTRPSMPRRRESAIADHGAQLHLSRCCTNLIRALNNFQQKGAERNTQLLNAQMESARDAVSTLNHHLWTLSQGLFDDMDRGDVGLVGPETAEHHRGEPPGLDGASPDGGGVPLPTFRVDNSNVDVADSAPWGSVGTVGTEARHANPLESHHVNRTSATEGDNASPVVHLQHSDGRDDEEARVFDDEDDEVFV
eukprot:m.142202 g.142202  ORF g.142202 m.142202 type:complete len:1139 (+) comp11580_c0_seq2:162-3578(+)